MHAYLFSIRIPQMTHISYILSIFNRKPIDSIFLTVRPYTYVRAYKDKKME